MKAMLALAAFSLAIMLGSQSLHAGGGPQSTWNNACYRCGGPAYSWGYKQAYYGGGSWGYYPGNALGYYQPQNVAGCGPAWYFRGVAPSMYGFGPASDVCAGPGFGGGF